MKRITKPFVILFSTIILLVSCLSSDYDNVTYYADTAITAFSLGTLNRYLTTISSEGEDSTYSEEVTGSLYKFYIDQLKQEIYNPDSLPVGTDAEHVICALSTKNSGIVLVKNVDSDTLAYFSSTDSLDFTTPREFQVYSTDGMAYRKYIVSVNVHQEYADTFMWNPAGTCDMFVGLKDMRAVGFDDKMMVFGTDGAATYIYSSPTDSTALWTQLATNVSLDADAYRNMMVCDDELWTLNGKEILASSDGENWSLRSSLSGNGVGEDISRLAGSGLQKVYAITYDGRIVSSPDRGLTWEEEPILDNSDYIPTQNISFACYDVSSNENTERMILTGTRDLESCPEDSVALVWNKIEEYADDSQTHSWYLCNEKNKYELPRLANVQTMKYGDVMIAMGGEGQGTSNAEAFSVLYVSLDCGLTWQNRSAYFLPEDFDNSGSNVFAMGKDNHNYIWVICGGNGQVWRGRLTQLGWEENQTSFLK